jgi:hypothetical protein
MDGRSRLKQQLPYPYNQDLSQVLQHLNRRTVLGRQWAANDPVTAAYLAAAMRLVRQRLGPLINIMADDLVDDDIDRSVFSFLSQRAIAAEMAHNPDPFPRIGNTSTMRSTWKSQSDFIADLLSFALWPGYYPEDYQETRADGAEKLASNASLAEAVDDLAYRVTDALAEMASFRLQLIAIASADRSEIIRKALESKYHRAHSLWKQTYAEFLDARRLRLRPGMTLDQMTNILTSIVEGSMLRAISDPDADVLNRLERRSLLGTAAQAILNGCLEPIEDSDGRSVAEALDAIANRHEKNPRLLPSAV